MGFTGDNGGFSFGGSPASPGSPSQPSPTQPSPRPSHGRKHSHKRHSSVSTRSHSMQLMSGNDILDNDDDDTFSPKSTDESAQNYDMNESGGSMSLVMPTTAQLEQLSSSENIPIHPTRHSPMSISQIPQLGALLEEEEDDDGGSKPRNPTSSFKSYKTKRNSVDLDSLMKNAAPQRPIRPLSMHNQNTKSPFNFTSKVSQPPSFQRSGSTSSEMSNANSYSHSHSSIATSNSLSSPLTNASFGKSADFDYGGMPPIPSGNSSSNDANTTAHTDINVSSVSTPPRRKGSIQYRRSDDKMDDLAGVVGSGNASNGTTNKTPPKQLNLVNKARSGSISSSGSTETELYGSPSTRAFLEQQLAQIHDELGEYRDKHEAAERELAQERREREASEEVVQRLRARLDQLPSIHEHTAQVKMVREMREHVLLLTGDLDNCREALDRAHRDLEEARVDARFERDLRCQIEAEQREQWEEWEREQEERKSGREEDLCEMQDNSENHSHSTSHSPSHIHPPDDDDRPVRPHSLLVDWRFPMAAYSAPSGRIEEEEQEQEREEEKEVAEEEELPGADGVDFNDAFAHAASVSFGRDVSVDDEGCALPPIHTPPAQTAQMMQTDVVQRSGSNKSNKSSGNDSYGFFRSRSNSLLNRARSSFSPSANKDKKPSCVSRERQLDRLRHSHNGFGEEVDLSIAYANGEYTLSEL
ncbi:hypothetical protein E3P77_01648 [Wallemia ichthyophaga]|nr:hypothetical protein E3P77_01648 [Wallemia ichthyophaga]